MPSGETMTDAIGTTKADLLAWRHALFTSDRYVLRMRAAKTANLVVYGVVLSEAVYMYVPDGTLACGWKPPLLVDGLGSCPFLELLPLPETDKVLLTCENRTAVVCDLATVQCGEVTTDYADGETWVTAATEIGAKTGECLSAELCIIKTTRRTIHFLEIAGLDIVGFKVDYDLYDAPEYYYYGGSHLLALAEDHLWISTPQAMMPGEPANVTKFPLPSMVVRNASATDRRLLAVLAEAESEDRALQGYGYGYGVSGETFSVTVTFEMSAASITALLADKSAAIDGLTKGLADGLGVQPAAVTITSTVPDLLSRELLDDHARRLLGTATFLQLAFEVIGDSNLQTKAEALAAGDAGTIATVIAAVTAKLQAEGIAVTIKGVASDVASVTLTTYDTLSKIQPDWPTGATLPAFTVGVDHTKGYIQGILLWEHGSGFSSLGDAECTYYNLAKAAGKEDDVPQSAVCGSRAACEAACTAVGCSAFSFVPGSYVCELYNQCKMVDDAGSTVVKLDGDAKCTLNVENAVTPMEAGCGYDFDDSTITSCSLNGEYVQVSPTEYRTASNVSRIVVDATQPCLGWVLEQNKGAPSTKTLITYKNAPATVVEAYETMFREALAAAPKAEGGGQRWTRIRMKYGWLKGKPYPTECSMLCPNVGHCPLDAPGQSWEVPTGWNCNNPVLARLCVEQCDPPKKAVIGGKPVTFNDVGTSDGDADAAAAGLVNETLIPGGVDCSGFCTGCAKGVPCTEDPVVAFLCPKACKTRKLYIREESATVELLEDENFKPLFRTFANGSLTTTEGGLEEKKCPHVPIYRYKPSPELLASTIFPATIAEAPGLEVSRICATMAKCPALTTCIQTQSELEEEMTAVRGDVALSTRVSGLTPAEIAAILHSESWVDFTEQFDGRASDVRFPKTITSDRRAEAVIRLSFWDFGREIFRTAPAPTRVRLFYPLLPSSMIVSLSGTADHHALYNFGRVYPSVEGFTSWITDVVRIEAFTEDYKPYAGAFSFEIYVPGVTELQMFAFMGDSVVNVVEIGGSVNPSTTISKQPHNEDWWLVTVPAGYANADFAGALDVDECATWPCTELPEDGGTCVNQMGSYYCACAMGYKGTDGTFARAPLLPGVQCIKQMWDEVDHSFLVYHTDAVNYGWHVGEVRLFDGYDAATGKCVGTCKDGSLSPDCHYNDILGERGTPVPQKLAVSGTYPGKQKVALNDLDPAT
jgi:hypothetical protein